MEDRLKDAIIMGNLEETTALIDKGVDVNSVDETGGPLFWALASTEAAGVLEFLLAQTPDILLTDIDGNTALHVAYGEWEIMKIKQVERGNLRAVRLFLAYGADHTKKNNKKKIPIDLAKSKDIASKVKALIAELVTEGADSPAEAKKSPLSSVPARTFSKLKQRLSLSFGKKDRSADKSRSSSASTSPPRATGIPPSQSTPTLARPVSVPNGTTTPLPVPQSNSSPTLSTGTSPPLTSGSPASAAAAPATSTTTLTTTLQISPPGSADATDPTTSPGSSPALTPRSSTIINGYFEGEEFISTSPSPGKGFIDASGRRRWTNTGVGTDAGASVLPGGSSAGEASLREEILAFKQENFRQMTQLEDMKKKLADTSEKLRLALLREDELLSREDTASKREAKYTNYQTQIQEHEAAKKTHLARIDELQGLLTSQKTLFDRELVNAIVPIFTFNHLKLLPKVLGDGPFARIFKASWRGSIVAAKRFKDVRELESKTGITSDQTLHEFFLRELKFFGRFRHPNIVSLMAVCIAPESRTLLFEKCSRDLKTALATAGRLDIWAKLRIAHQAASAIAHIHESDPPTCHGNISMTSFLVNAQGTVKLAGLAFCAENIYDQNFCKTKAPKLSLIDPAFAAPEVLQSLAEFSVKRDVYSYGVILWQIMTGLVPWAGKSPEMIYAEVTTGTRLPVPDETPEDIANLIRWCWLEKAANRPEMSRVVAELGRIKKATKALALQFHPTPPKR